MVRPEIGVKKKFTSTVGKISLDKDHPFVQGNYDGIAITPLLQDHYLRLTSEMVPKKASEHLNALLGIEGLTNNSQAYRLLHLYGSSEEIEAALRSPCTSEELQLVDNPVSSKATKEVIYSMFDGGHFPYDGGFKEVKIGRVFRGSQIESTDQVADKEQNTARNRVLNSEYLMREGHYEQFVNSFGELVNAHQAKYPKAQLVFITDGATWMRNWIAQTYPQAVSILDFFHAYEHLCEFGTHVWKDLELRNEQLKLLKIQLSNGEVDKIIEKIKAYGSDQREVVAEQAESLLTYLTNNRDRMHYDQYRNQGYLIGSGAIESAVRSVAQQRCKLSGQRWSNGLQPVLNLRALYCSGKGKRMRKIIVNQFNSAA